MLLQETGLHAQVSGEEQSVLWSRVWKKERKKRKGVYIRKLSLQQQNIKDVNSSTEFNTLYNSQQEH